MTKAEMRKVARRARRWGHFQTGPGAFWVKCPLCEKRVEGQVGYYDHPKRGWTRQTTLQAIDAAVIFHLETDHDEE